MPLPRAVPSFTSVRSAAAILASTLLSAACAGGAVDASEGATPKAGGASANTDTGSSPSLSANDAGSAASAAQSSDCSTASQLVYVVSADGDLYSFTPNTLTFSLIGTPSCSNDSATPVSMAVDRTGTAWVSFTNNDIFKVSTSDASCTATAFGQGAGLTDIVAGMGFSTDSSTSTSESLFVNHVAHEPSVFAPIATNRTAALTHLDTTSLALTDLGTFPSAYQGHGLEYTGTGDGRLFGFFGTAPGRLAQIDKTTAALTNEIILDGIDNSGAYAFSFWGGDFWFYVASDGPSQVWRLETSVGATTPTLVLDDVGGFQIVGAGVSTCAPLTPPVK